VRASARRAGARTSSSRRAPQSIPIDTGQEDWCALLVAPGTYEYRIDLTSGGEGVGGRSMGENLR
jgi:hypothetical protein